MCGVQAFAPMPYLLFFVGLISRAPLYKYSYLYFIHEIQNWIWMQNQWTWEIIILSKIT